MKPALGLLVVLLALAQPAPAQEAEPTPAPATPEAAPPAEPEPASTLLEITGTRQIVDQMKQRILQSQLQTLLQHGLDADPDSSAPTRAFVQQLDDFMSPHLSWQQLEPEFVQLYNAVFTREEITGLIEFYQSPLGEKILRKMPELLQQTATLTHTRAQAISPDIQKMTGEFIAARKQAAAATPAPVAPAGDDPAPPPSAPAATPPDLEL